MLHGDISNRQAPIICFDSNILFRNEPIATNPIEKFFGKLFSGEEYSFFNRTINLSIVNLINNIWYSQDLSIYIAVSEQSYIEGLTDALDVNDVNYTRLLYYPSMDFLRDKCHYEYYYYVSNDEKHLSNISMKNAVTIDELTKLLNTARR